MPLGPLNYFYLKKRMTGSFCITFAGDAVKMSLFFIAAIPTNELNKCNICLVYL